MSDTNGSHEEQNKELANSDTDNARGGSTEELNSSVTTLASEILDIEVISHDSLHRHGVHAGAIKKKILEQIGGRAYVQLCVCAAALGTNVQKYGHVVINCRGKINGTRTIDQLIDENVLATKRSAKEDWTQPDTPTPINVIFDAAPYIPLMFLRISGNREKLDSLFQKNIKTSLPIELQYVQAGALPLPANLRMAHIAFTVKFFKSIKRGFYVKSYNDQINRSVQFEKSKNLMAILKELEANIVLNDDEVGMTVEKAAPLQHQLMTTNSFYSL